MTTMVEAEVTPENAAGQMPQEASPSRPGRLLVVDDEPNIARILSSYFARQGWEVRTCNHPLEALNEVAEIQPDVVITDLSMPEMTGVELLGALRERGHQMPVLLVTAHGTIDSAVAALKFGAFDYLCKPFELDRVKAAVERAYLHGQLLRENEHLRQELAARYQFGNLIGSSPRMQEVYDLIQKAARSNASVLLLGESGTGKELVARALHYNSLRAKRRFVAVSCAALPSELLESELFGHEKGAFTGANWQRIGRFELADGGTLFLDEIGDISLNVQSKLMRALQEREIDRVGGSKPVKVDVRLITATNKDLHESIAKGDFRDDLYYRLRVVEIRLPALRERKEDIPLLARHFIEKLNERDHRKLRGVSEAALAALTAYDWPGNVRELENAIEHAIVMADEGTEWIEPAHLPGNLTGTLSGADMSAGGPLTAAVAEVERKLVLDALRKANWDLQTAADTLGITLSAMRHQVRKHHLSGDRRPAPK